MTFPILPKSDDDFTPELARKIISKYQELVAIWKERHDLVLQKDNELQAEVRQLRMDNARLRDEAAIRKLRRT